MEDIHLYFLNKVHMASGVQGLLSAPDDTVTPSTQAELIYLTFGYIKLLDRKHRIRVSRAPRHIL